MIQIEDKIYFSKKNINSKRTIFRKLKIKPRSYIATIISRLYDYYFANAVSLEKEFHKYYKKEFRNFEVFLRNKHNLFDWEIKSLGRHNIYFSHSQPLEEYSIGVFATDIYDDLTLFEALINSMWNKV
jgi:hypothetical protein